MKRFIWIKNIIGLILGMLLWTALPVWAAAICNANIRATTPTSDFTLDDSNGTATHLKTGLMWMRCALGRSWDSANKTCIGNTFIYTWSAALRAAQGYSFVGYNDWRLPNVKELTTINEDRCDSPSINETVFPGMVINGHWSSSTSASDPTQAFTLGFLISSDSQPTPKSWGFGRVLLVRGGSSFGDYVSGGGGGGAPVTLEVLDGRDYWRNGQFTTSTEVLTDPFLGQPMDGAAADGEARLLLRASVPGPGKVLFIVAADGETIKGNGTFLSLDGSTEVEFNLYQDVVQTPRGYKAFVVYRPPEGFVRPGHESEDGSKAERPLQFIIIYEPQSGTEPPPVTKNIQLARPPVVLIHGWNSNKKDSWGKFSPLLISRIPGISKSITEADYAKTSNDAFSVNASVPREAVGKARGEFRQRHIAVAQADVIGHSMGGILSRIWAGESEYGEYRRWANFGAGDFNKLITMDSPHRGSPIANALYSANDLTNLALHCYGASIVVCIPQPQPENALRDLSTDSTALAAMRSREAKVPSHAIVGNYTGAQSVDLLTDDEWMSSIGKALRDAGLSTLTATWIGNDPSDAIVKVPSQKGDLPGTCSESNPAQCSEFNETHVGIHDAPEVADRVVELLNAPATDGDLFNQNGFPWSNNGNANLSVHRMAAANAATIVEGGIQIASPSGGTVVQPGQAVTVTVQPDSGVALESASLVTYQTWLHLDQAPFQFSLSVPTGAVGTLGLLVSAKDTAGVIHLAHTSLQVVPSVALSRLDANPATVTFEQAGVQAGLQVDGVYADSTVRDLTVGGTGTTYQSSNPGVVTVDANGRLTAQSNGNATVTATNNGVSAYATVRVEAGTDLAISQTDSPDPIGADGLVTYTLTVQNLGTQRALDLRVSDTLPTGATLVQASGTGWVCSEAGGVVSCIRDTLDAGATATISLKVEVPLSCGVIANQATVNASTQDGNVDDNISATTSGCPPQTYPLTVTRAGTGSGTVTGTGINCGSDCTENYTSGASVTLAATATTGSKFTGWSGACTGTAATCAVSMTAARSVTATFVPSFALTVAKSGSGTVTSNPTGINCGSDCSEAYPAGTGVTLTATPTTGWQFAGWSGACTGTGTCSVAMTAAKSVTATFTRPVLTVTKAGSGAGLITGTGINCGVDCTESYNLNTIVTLTATAYGGSTFTGWSGACTGTGACTVSMTASKTVTATFNTTTAGKTALTLYKSGAGLGTVASSPAGINCGTACGAGIAYFTTGASVTLTVTPAVGSTFTGWGGACAGTVPTCTIPMSAARVVTATFTRPVLAVTKAGSGAGLITGNGINCGVDCTESYNLNTIVTLTAAPAAGSTFVGWSGACTGTGACTVSMTASKTVTATFNTTTAGTYALTLYKIGAGLGTVASNPAGINCGAACVANFTSGRLVTLTATAAAGSTFTGWGGACAGTARTCTVTMSAARIVTANFTRPVLTVTKAGSGTVTSNPAGINCGADCSEAYNLNTSVALTAIPTTGWQFAGWSGACTGTGACTVAMTAAKTVVATFKPKLTVTKVGSGTVTSSPAGINCGTTCAAYFPFNGTVTLTAAPAAGQKLKSWAGCTTASGNTCTVGMAAAKTVTATFGL